MVAKTFFGLEECLMEELKSLGAGKVQKLNRAVGFSGDNKLMYRLNYCLRTAIRILKQLGTARVSDDRELYRYCRSIPWQQFMDVKDTFAVEAVVASESFTHSHYVEQKIKDAIVDQFRERLGKRPSVNLALPDLRIHAHISGTNLTLSFDSSGDPLYKRGYREKQGPAPLNEVLAAGLIKLSGWDLKTPFVDGMCGSGTLPVEAALMAFHIPPGHLGRSYGFQKWKDYDEDLFRLVVSESVDSMNREQAAVNQYTIPILASDVDPSAVRLARLHAARAGVEKKIRFSNCSFDELTPPPGPGTLIINPPYGERVRQEKLNDLYALIGNKLKKDFTGYQGWIFSGNTEAMKHVALHPSRRISLYNGQLQCKFQCFRMYEGSGKKSG